MSMLPLFKGEDAYQPKPLRPHQERAMRLLKTSFLAGNRRIVICLATGAGKTRLAAEIVNGSLGKGRKVAFTVPMITLVDQTVASFENEGIDCIGVMQANHPRTHYGMPVQICSLKTVSHRFRPEADIVIVDECHSRSEVIDRWMEERPETTFIGLSATPWAKGMADKWQDMIIPVTMPELIDQGYLSPFRVYAPSHPDLSGVRTSRGDYREEDLSKVMGEAKLMADIVGTWLKLANWEPTLVFAVDKAHAKKLQKEFAAAGVPMGYCDADVDLVERKVLFDRMARREIAGIVNIGTLTTGVDADVRCIVIARPTKSEMLHVQIIGRALRTAPGKEEALIIDHSDNHARLGFVTDIHHDRLLAGKAPNHKTRKENGEPMPKECGSCGVLKPAKVHQCPACGFAPERQSEIEVEAGELVEVKKGKKKAEPSVEEKQRWYSELLGVARIKGRKPGWAFHSYQKRFGKEPPTSFKKIARQPSQEVMAFARHLDIAFAKARGAR